MSEESAGLSANPMFGVMIGQQIDSNKSSNQAFRHADDMSQALQKTNNAAVQQGQASLRIAEAAVSLRQKMDSLEREILELEAFDQGANTALAGVRGVTRELLNELRKADPKNPLLDKKNRDKIFETMVSQQELNQEGKLWRERKEEAAQYRDSAYGAEGSNKGGPEKSQITSNKQVVAEAGVPEHVTDRERFMALIKELHSTLAAKDPNAPILKSQTMIDVFSEYALNEMDRQPAAGNKSGV